MILRILLLATVLLLIGGAVLVQDIVDRPLPQHAGAIIVEGLQADVNILRDIHGTPHIYASNMHDLFFAQGYIQAQDRWWQMEFWRHTASGTLSELVGRTTASLRADIFIRTLGWRQVAERELAEMDDQTRLWLEAFCKGINAYISTRSPSQLALEYTVLGLTGIKFDVAPWTPIDTLVFGKLMAWDMGLEESKDILRGALYERIGRAMTDAWLTPPWPYDERPTIIRAEDLPALTEGDALNVPSSEPAVSGTGQLAYIQKEWSELSTALGTGPGGGTNAWVVSGTHTESGMPLLANDTHLGIQLPSVWYQIGLHCAEGADPAFDVVGFTFPASLGVVVGHNGLIAWGISNGFPDVHDAYQLRINPEDPFQYEWNGLWRDMTVREETIQFGDGSEPVVIEVRETHLGPIVTDNRLDSDTGEVLDFDNEEPIAQRWTALDSGTVSRAVLAIDQATDWNTFRDALRYWDIPAQHFVYADTSGNIGYQFAGRVPIRAKGHDGLAPSSGWTDEFEWKGFLPFNALPYVLNPVGGVIVAANHAAVPPSYYDALTADYGEGFNYTLSQDIDYAYRAARIEELLAATTLHSIETFQEIQADAKLLSANEILPYFIDLELPAANLTSAREWLLGWDRRFTPSSSEAVLYACFWRNLVLGTFGDELGSDASHLVGGDREMWAIRLLLAEPDNAWWDDVSTNDRIERRDEILLSAFANGYSDAVALCGTDRTFWAWGDVHTATFVSNPLGKSGVGLFEGLVNRGPFSVGGMTDTVNNTRWTASLDSFDVKSIPALRMIIDLADLASSVGIHSTGQSGHPLADGYDNLIESWRSVDTHPMLWTREQVIDEAAYRLILKSASRRI
ncbi:penicillin acylase family protein [Candidatus Bipolaricaulota bacterium]